MFKILLQVWIYIQVFTFFLFTKEISILKIIAVTSIGNTNGTNIEVKITNGSNIIIQNREKRKTKIFIKIYIESVKITIPRIPIEPKIKNPGAKRYNSNDNTTKNPNNLIIPPSLIDYLKVINVSTFLFIFV